MPVHAKLREEVAPRAEHPGVQACRRSRAELEEVAHHRAERERRRTGPQQQRPSGPARGRRGVPLAPSERKRPEEEGHRERHGDDLRPHGQRGHGGGAQGPPGGGRPGSGVVATHQQEQSRQVQRGREHLRELRRVADGLGPERVEREGSSHQRRQRLGAGEVDPPQAGAEQEEGEQCGRQVQAKAGEVEGVGLDAAGRMDDGKDEVRHWPGGPEEGARVQRRQDPRRIPDGVVDLDAGEVVELELATQRGRVRQRHGDERGTGHRGADEDT